MFPGMNPRDMQKAMKKLGIKQEDIDAQEVIIRTNDKDLVIRNPQVSKINMMGQETIQVIGDIEEIERSKSVEISDDDIKTVMEQANVSSEDARLAIERNGGNLAAAIMELKGS